MHETGIEGYCVLKDGKKLRFGYTTGTCAAGAAKAAARMLVTGRIAETVDILTPKGIALNLEVLEPALCAGSASCAVRKYSGDDPDVTDGALVWAEVSWQAQPGIAVDGGLGVGRVTKPGLKQKVGEAAINPVPMFLPWMCLRKRTIFALKICSLPKRSPPRCWQGNRSASVPTCPATENCPRD